MEDNDKFFDFDQENITPQSSNLLPHSNGAIQPIPTQSLSIGKPNTSNEDINQTAKAEFDAVMQTAKSVDARLAILLAQNEGTVRRVFPTKMQKLISEKERLMAGTALDFRLNLLKLGNQFQLEALRDKYDVYLKCYKGQNRLLLTQFMIQKLKELYRTVKQEEMEAFRELEGMYMNAAQLSIPTMKKNYIQRIQGREVRLMETIEKLLVKFESIIDENLIY